MKCLWNVGFLGEVVALASLSRVLVGLSFVSVASVGCSEGSQQSGSRSDWETFRASAKVLSDGTFIVDGDIRLHREEEIRRYFDSYQVAQPVSASGTGAVATSSESLKLMQADGVDSEWSFSARNDITYCVSSNFGSRFDEVVEELGRAAKSWSDRIGVRFRYVSLSSCTSASAVTFNVRLAVAGFYGSAFFPHQPRSERELLFTEAAFTTSAEGRDFQGIARHELGHILGFRHEHIDITCTGEGPDDPDTTDVEEGARDLTPYDVNSVMHYPQCRPSGTGGYRQTESDYRGGNFVYGLAHALITASNL